MVRLLATALIAAAGSRRGDARRKGDDRRRLRVRGKQEALAADGKLAHGFALGLSCFHIVGEGGAIRPKAIRLHGTRAGNFSREGFRGN